MPVEIGMIPVSMTLVVPVVMLVVPVVSVPSPDAGGPGCAGIDCSFAVDVGDDAERARMPWKAMPYHVMVS